MSGASHSASDWLRTKLFDKGYPDEYLRVLMSGQIAAPRVAIRTSDGDDGAAVKCVAHVVQEATDLSLGALFVEESHRRKGLGEALLRRMSKVIAETGLVAPVSLVEESNIASVRLHERAGWSAVNGSFVCLVFQRMT
eukprot:TRINITY_DN21995_c0_g1_i1.p1 TRINITY_DN21995_c0_g1~~TRINITY_DN21995_c0_g1_i1.p1  ORF type:complete len:138 (+),score=20.61 TRINITY_DN21995_c0_g1_i1:353-766(+)